MFKSPYADILVTIFTYEQIIFLERVYVSYVCDNQEYIVNGNKVGYPFCSAGKVIQIREAKYGRIDGGSKCNMTNPAVPCESRTGYQK